MTTGRGTGKGKGSGAGTTSISRLPERSFFLPAALKRAAWARRIVREARAAPRVLHLTHAGCLDGAASDLVLRLEAGAADVATAFVEPHETVAALEEVADVPGRGRRLVVTDLSLQRDDAHRALAVLARLSSRGWSVEWRDHHARQWDGAPLHGLRDHARILLDMDGKECGATLLAKDVGVDAPWVARLLAAVRDHDLWLQKDPLGVRLQDAARRLGSAAFVRHLLATRDPEDSALLAAADEEAEHRRRQAAAGVAAARFVARGKARVAVAYGDLPTNDVLHALYTDGGAAVAVLLKPEGTFSLRSRKGVDVCHRVAQAFGGGGHPNAAGGTLRLSAADLPLYWARRGRIPKAERVVDAALDEAEAAAHVTR